MLHGHLASTSGLSLTTTSAKPRSPPFSYHLTKRRQMKHTEGQDKNIDDGVILQPILSSKLSARHKGTVDSCGAHTKQASLTPGTHAGRDSTKRFWLIKRWFWMTQGNACYLMLADEDATVWRVQHKKYMTKVMFLCAQARWDYANTRQWMASLACGQFVGWYNIAKRSSVNRPAGTRMWVDETMDSTKYQEMMMDMVVPASLERWPLFLNWRTPIFIRLSSNKMMLLTTALLLTPFCWTHSGNIETMDLFYLVRSAETHK